ncbi:MAG: 2-oxoacid:acceptor oxidoreductase subunit alpha [Planctomycetes bacterium]|nr:2-oxoacid:acceptor oxidoreductase subunit alpha [Planctomycetota bacterium]
MNQMDLNIRIAGEAGQGVASAGALVVGAVAELGVHVLASQSYMSRIRGGLNWYDIRVGSAELFGPREKADLLVALTPVALELLRGELTPGGLILFDGESAGEGAAALAFTKKAKEAGGSTLMANTVAAGAVFAVLGYNLDELCNYLARQFKKKGDEVIQANIRCARAGAELAGGLAGKMPGPRPAGAPKPLSAGAEAIGLSAAVSGAKFATAYPMSPSTATFAYLAAVADKYNIVVEQAEDEIAAVNMACGAVYAGAPALVTTSGGGFALMVEGLALAGMLELPVVIVLAQRPGPATGLPTRTAQQDLAFSLSAGHGEFPRAIFAPGTIGQCYDLTRRALQTAHKYQTPAIILTDQFLQDMQKNGPPLPDKPDPIDRCIVADAGTGYVRHAVTESGVSPRAIPGGAALVVSDSDEHDQAGHLTEDLDTHLVQHDKRMRKHAGLLGAALPPEWYGPADAKTVLLAWGSTYGPAREAVDILNAGGQSAAMLHFGQVWPIDAARVRDLLNRRATIVSVEGNSTAQFAGLLKQLRAIDGCRELLRYDGMPFTAEYIVGRMKG